MTFAPQRQRRRILVAAKFRDKNRGYSSKLESKGRDDPAPRSRILLAKSGVRADDVETLDPALNPAI